MPEQDPTFDATYAGGEVPGIDLAELARLLADGHLGSVWLTGQHPSRDLRRGRYTPESMRHPAKMLPTITRYAIRTYTQPGETVLDPMAGVGTTIVEAMHLGRHGIGVEYEPEWAAHAAANIRLAEQTGATGHGAIYTGDSTRLPALLPAALRGQVALVITSPPYGPSTHGHVRTPGPRHGKVGKLHHRYGGGDNLAYRGHRQLADGFTAILAGCATLLRPGGHVVVTARPYRRHGELIDIPGMVEAAGVNAGLDLIEHCIAPICGIRNNVIVPRASFFQLKNLRDAIAAGDPQWLVQHEDALTFRLPNNHVRRPGVELAGGPSGALDVFTPHGMDRRPHPAHPADAQPGGSATEPRSQLGRDDGRTPDPCPPHTPPEPPAARRDPVRRRPAEPDQRAGSSAPADRR